MSCLSFHNHHQKYKLFVSTLPFVSIDHMLLQIFVIAFATFYALSAVAQVVDLENHGFVIRIDDRAFMRMVIDEAILARELLIVFTSRNDNIDAYGKLYVGWLQHLFTSLRFNTRLCTLVLDMSLSRGQISANFDYFLSILPEESVFVVCDHGPADMDIRALNYVTTAKERSNPRTNDTISLQHYRPVADFAIFHLNHEQPWNFNAGTWNVRYSSKKHLFETSSAHRLLFRNYFYSPLSKAAGVLQLPLGPAYYGFKGPYFGPQLQLQTSPSSLRTTTPISQRPVKCRFIGRQTYGKDNQEFVPERDDFMVLAHQLTFSEVVQVNATHIIGWKDGTDNDKKHDTITGSASFPCDAVDSLDYSRLVGYLEAYTLSLTLTRFVPCPPGNNPETFRHYEALEAGAIPLILRGLVHSEFLTSSYWAGYPGPLFTNWQDAGRFVQTISDEEADVLQIVVQEWYVGMKQSMQQVVEGVVLQHFPFVAKNKDAGFGSDSGPGHYLDVDTHSTSALVSNITEQEMYCPDHSCVVSAVTLGHHGTFQLVLHRGHRPEDAVSDFLRDHSAEFTTSGLEDVRKVILIQLCQQIGALGPQDVLSACDGEPEREVLVSMLIAGWHNEYLCLRRGYGLTHYVTMLCAWWGCTEQRQMYIKQLYIAQTIYQLLLENNPAIADPALMDSVVVQKGDMQALFGDLLYPLTNYAYQKSSVRVDITLGVGWGDGEREVVISVVVLQGQHPEDAVGDLLMQKSTLRLLGLGPEVESGSSSSARAHVEVVYREIMDVLCPHLAVSAPHIIQCRGIYHSENEDGGSDEVGDGRSAVLYTLNISKTDMDMDDGADIGADHVHLHSAQELLPLVHVRKGYSVDFYVYLVCMQLRCNMEKQRQVEAALRRLSLVPWINNSRSMLADGECVSCSVGDACISRRQRQSRRLGDSEATVARVMVTFGGQHGANLRYSFGSGTNPRHGETETVTALLKVFTVMRPEDAVADFLLQHGLDDPDCYMMSKSEPQSSAEIEIGHFTGTRGRCINAEEQRVEIMRQLCPTVHKLRSMTLPLRECSEQNGQGGLYSIGRRIFTSVNLSSLLPPECQECPLVHVRTGYTLVELRGWVGDQVCCRGDGGDPRSYLSPEVITALEVAVMGAVWNILKDREKLLVHIKDYSEEDLVLLGRLYDSTVLGKQSYPYLQAREEEGAVGNAPIGAKSGALMRRTARNDTYKRYGLHPRCLIPLTEENVGANKVQARTAIYAVLCRNSVVVLYTSILVLAYEHGSSPIGAPTRSSQTEETEQTGPLPMSERNWIPFVLYSEQRLADAAADFLFEHQRRLLDKETVFQDILDQLCPLLADAKIAVQHTGKRVSLCDSDAASGLNGDLNDNDGGSSTSVKGSNIGVNGKSPLVVSIDLSHALPFPVPIYPWLHMRTLYTLEFYTAMVCTQLQCDALKELIVGAAVKKEYLRAMELRDVRGRYCDLSTRVELLGQKTQVRELTHWCLYCCHYAMFYHMFSIVFFLPLYLVLLLF